MVRVPICCALVLLASVVPRAGQAEEDPRAQAGAEYARGIQLAEQGLYAAALEQFKSAYGKSPHFAVLYNIGQAQMALGRPIEAIEALTRYLRDGADQVPLSRREQVQAQIALLEGRLAELSVTTDRSGALVTVDGREVAGRRCISRSGWPRGRTRCRSRWRASRRSSGRSICARVIVRRWPSSSRPRSRRSPRPPRCLPQASS